MEVQPGCFHPSGTNLTFATVLSSRQSNLFEVPSNVDDCIGNVPVYKILDANDSFQTAFDGLPAANNGTGKPLWHVIVFGFLATSVGLVTVTGNLVVILSFVLERNIRQPTNYFIASLAVSDLLIGTISMPFYTIYLLSGQHWPLGEGLCDLWLSIDYTACLCSIYTVFCITADRYCSVKFPARYRKWRTERKVIVMVMLTWIVPVAVFFTSIFGWQYFTGRRTVPVGKCFVQYMEDALFNCLLQVVYFWLTLVLMFFLYGGIYRVALDLHRRSAAKRQKNMACLISMAGKTVTQIGSVMSISRNHYRMECVDRNFTPSLDGENLSSRSEKLTSTSFISATPSKLPPTEFGRMTVNMFFAAPSSDQTVHPQEKRIHCSNNSVQFTECSEKRIHCKKNSESFIEYKEERMHDKYNSLDFTECPEKRIHCRNIAKQSEENVLNIPGTAKSYSVISKPSHQPSISTDERRLLKSVKFIACESDKLRHDFPAIEVYGSVDSSSLNHGEERFQSVVEVLERSQTSFDDLPYVDEEPIQILPLTIEQCEIVQLSESTDTQIPDNGVVRTNECHTELAHQKFENLRTTENSSKSEIGGSVDESFQESFARRMQERTLFERRFWHRLNSGEMRPFRPLLRDLPDVLSVDEPEADDTDVEITCKQKIPKLKITSPSIAEKINSLENSSSLPCKTDKDESTSTPDDMSLSSNSARLIQQLKERGRALFHARKESTISGTTLQGSTGNDDDRLTLAQRQQITQSRNDNRTRKALRTITIILGAFVVCWIPWHVLSMIIGFCRSRTLCVSPTLYDISYWLCYLNSPINPFCYAFANQQFKQTFLRILRFDFSRS